MKTTVWTCDRCSCDVPQKDLSVFVVVEQGAGAWQPSSSMVKGDTITRTGELCVECSVGYVKLVRALEDG